jgi:hypothetical protein
MTMWPLLHKSGLTSGAIPSFAAAFLTLCLIRADNQQLRVDMRADIKQLRAETRADMSDLKREVQETREVASKCLEQWASHQRAVQG